MLFLLPKLMLRQHAILMCLTFEFNGTTSGTKKAPAAYHSEVILLSSTVKGLSLKDCQYPTQAELETYL